MEMVCTGYSVFEGSPELPSARPRTGFDPERGVAFIYVSSDSEDEPPVKLRRRRGPVMYALS